MAQDYHIYIHSDSPSSNGGGSQTKPFSSEKQTAFKPKSSMSFEDENDIIDEGASALSKVSGALALATAIYKTADKVLSTGFAHLREYTGHYEYEMNFNNFKTALNHVFNPVGYIKQTIYRDFQFRKENQRIEQEAQIIGKTIYTDTKIGV